MKIAWLLVVSLCIPAAPGQEVDFTLDDVVESAQQWARNNLDQDALSLLESADQDQVRQLLRDIQAQFQGEYVVDLAPLREGARIALPLLQAHPETVPYAKWLKARMDYLEFAEQLRLVIPSPTTETNNPPATLPNPSPETSRELWSRRMSRHPMSPEATAFALELKPVFFEEQVPTELIWLAEVESGFDPAAQSPAGAAGLFQLMPATARQYGLETWPFDERLEPRKSARAAAKYLRTLYRRFKDWRLVLAAYNAGEGTVDRLLRKQDATTYDAIATHLPAETQLFVPSVEALVERREGVKLNELTPIPSAVRMPAL